jgi:hypothetical protein
VQDRTQSFKKKKMLPACFNKARIVLSIPARDGAFLLMMLADQSMLQV